MPVAEAVLCNVGEASSLPTGKAWKEKGNTATLTLINGDVLEFVKCPPGQALLRINRNTAKRVKITRPFWIMTRPLAKRNFKLYPEYQSIWTGQDGLYDYPRVDYDTAISFAETLTEEIKESLPNGYIVRFPTAAELNRAILADSRKPNDPYREFDNLHSEAAKKIFIDDPQGKSPKNNWGIHEFAHSEFVLDKGSKTELLKFDGGWQPDGIYWKPEYMVDPLVWSEEENAKPLGRMFSLNHPSYLDMFLNTKMTDRAICLHTRLVIGPDLVSEWRKKHAKK